LHQSNSPCKALDIVDALQGRAQFVRQAVLPQCLYGIQSAVRGLTPAFWRKEPSFQSPATHTRHTSVEQAKKRRPIFTA
jgi:hypothetical protein